MSHLRAFGRFWYDFIVGDDWQVAVGVTLAVIATFVIAHHDANLWWLLPIAVPALLGVSLHRATRRSPAAGSRDTRR